MLNHYLVRMSFIIEVKNAISHFCLAVLFQFFVVVYLQCVWIDGLRLKPCIDDGSKPLGWACLWNLIWSHFLPVYSICIVALSCRAWTDFSISSSSGTRTDFKILLVMIQTTDSIEDDISSYPEGLVLVPRGSDDGSVVVGPHIRGSRLRASSAAGGEEVDLLLPGTARFDFFGKCVVS